MTIQELKEKKQALEKEIMEKLKEFQKETGMDASFNFERKRIVNDFCTCFEIEEIKISITSIIAQNI